MKKQTLILNFLAIIIFSFVACKTEKPSSSTAPEEEQTMGLTGIATIDNLTQRLVDNPNDPKLFATRAKAFYENENYDHAIQDMAYAMKVDSNNAEYHHLLSDIYLDYYKSRLALKTMKRCVSIHPKSIPSLLKLADIQQLLKQYDASMASVARVMKIEPNNPHGFFKIGLNHSLKGNKQMAIKSLQQCVDLEPDYTDAWVLLGQIFEGDKSKLAAQYFENATQTAPDNPDILYNQASYLHNQNQLDESATLLRKIISIDKRYANAFHRLGIIYIEKDSLDKAYENFNIAVSVKPEFGIAYYYRGYTSELQGKLESAKVDYQNILNFEPDYQKAKEGLARVNQALKIK